MPTKEIIEYVGQITSGRAVHALQLVKYNYNVEKSVQYAFGDAFVCDDGETAKMVAYDPRVGMRCVTL